LEEEDENEERFQHQKKKREDAWADRGREMAPAGLRVRRALHPLKVKLKTTITKRKNRWENSYPFVATLRR
jgi:hypothetical protein